MDVEPHPLHYRLKGNPRGRPILLLHGITGSGSYWRGAEGDLGRDHLLLMPDLIGFGDSPKPDVDYRVDLFVETLRGLLEDLGWADRPCLMVGHSLGAIVGLEYLVRHPGAFERMAILSLPRYASREEAHTLFLEGSVNYRRILGVNDWNACLRSIRRVGPEVFLNYVARFPLRVIRDSKKWSLRSLLTTLENCLLEYRVDEVLERVPPVPALLLHGARDRVTPLANVRPAAERPGWRLAVVEGTGHHLFLTHPQACLREIRAFFGAAAAAARPPRIAARAGGG
jgi:pimeloyl-ACP methyl ester carboxylesterase